MTVLNIASTEIKDAEKMKSYIGAAAPLMRSLDAEVIVRGTYLKNLLGDGRAKHIVGVFRFRDMETAERFYSCDEYVKLIPLRDAAGAMEFRFYQE